MSLFSAFSLLFVRNGCNCHFPLLLMEGVNELRPNKSVVKWQRHPSLTNNNENAENNDIWNALSNTIS